VRSLKNSQISFLFIALLACQTAFADGGPITGNRFSNSIAGGVGPTGPTGSAGSGGTGPTGPTGAAGAGFTASYGQLYLTSAQSINLDAANVWVAIPFNGFSPSSNMTGSTTSPATITILQAGTYQMSISIYFSSEDSPEHTFNATTYTIGTSINSGTTVPCTAVYAGEAGFFSLNFNTIREFAVNDTIQFYMETSAVGAGGIFDNIVSLESGNANLVQISN
jgi:hypothetical protein